MRSRSSRLFVVLLHLVGISNNLPNNPFKRVGIIGVHPLSILLEPLELQAAGGLGDLLSLLEGAGYDVDETVLGEPYWLQDDTDGTCLGPSGFSECGDSTLWKIRRRAAIHPKRGNDISTAKSTMDIKDEPKGFLALFRWEAGDENQINSTNDQWEYALEWADVNTSMVFGEDDSVIRGKVECMLSISDDEESNEEDRLRMGSCESDDAWSWSINEGGVLTWQRNYSSIRSEERKEFGVEMILGGSIARLLDVTSDAKDENLKRLHTGSQEDQRCLWKTNDASAIAATCAPSGNENAVSPRSLVSLSLIQYQNSAAVSPQLPRFPRNQQILNEPQGTESPDPESVVTESHLPKMKRSSQDHAAIHDQHQPIGRAPGPHLNAGLQPGRKDNVRIHEISSPLGVGGLFEKSKVHSEIRSSNLLRHPPSPSASPSHDEILHRPRKIPKHPYIEASKNGYYFDEITGMNYPTDICEYLGHDRKEVGRHTLMGLGLFTKTMLKIKVYGVAFYVSKRDVLNDPGFSEFAEYDADELRENDDFYKHLMTMGSSPKEEAQFDRTLFIKLNMQLAAETVRQSLTAEWKLLTEEHKEILSSSSFRERDADERMLQTIQSEENSSNCSCGQNAPPEYEADKTCCARGTELVFTWRKNGDMELRVNGRLIETYPYPEIGKGIFFEYLRGDDPMSMDARDRFVDGFPFLLAPLAKLKGFVPKKELSSSSSSGTSGTSSIPKQRRKKSAKDWNKLFGEAWENVSSRADDAMSWVQGNVNGGISNVNSAFRQINTASQNIGSNLHNFGSEIDRRRDQVWDSIMHSQQIQMSARMILSRIPFLTRVPYLNKSLDMLHQEIAIAENSNDEHILLSNETFFRNRNVFQPPQIAKLLENFNKQRPISDEIGIIIEPTMNFSHMMFLYLVHFYLVLLLIVSVPDSSTTRLVVKRSSDISTLDSESDHEERCKQLSLDDYKEFSCSERMRMGPCGPWSDVPDAIPRFVVEKNGIEQNNVDVLSATTAEDHDEEELSGTGSSSRQQPPMQKSLSYFL